MWSIGTNIDKPTEENEKAIMRLTHLWKYNLCQKGYSKSVDKDELFNKLY